MGTVTGVNRHAGWQSWALWGASADGVASATTLRWSDRSGRGRRTWDYCSGSVRTGAGWAV